MLNLSDLPPPPPPPVPADPIYGALERFWTAVTEAPQGIIDEGARSLGWPTLADVSRVRHRPPPEVFEVVCLVRKHVADKADPLWLALYARGWANFDPPIPGVVDDGARWWWLNNEGVYAVRIRVLAALAAARSVGVSRG